MVSSVKFALKCQEAGVDAVVAEGFEAGGHNGREETTTLSLIPNVRRQVDLPLIAAGGIALGSQIKAAMLLGAEGVQIGSRFAATKEASSHDNFKQKIVETQEGGTHLTLKELAPVRLIKNKFYNDIEKLYESGRDQEALRSVLGRARAKKGMFEGDMEEGELEIGQSSALIDSILSVEKVFEKLLKEFDESSCPEL
ncbi:Nitronate monooxygenase [Elizabethkingia miricola]|nr:Nitronate monooxygenase [Elizabethkingia miricola]